MGVRARDMVRRYLDHLLKVAACNTDKTGVVRIARQPLATVKLSDFKGRVEFDVRSALLDVRAAEQQLETAQGAVGLANQELQQARDRFAAGVAGNIEVTQAQEAVAAASETYIAALYAHNLAKASLARAVGAAEQEIVSYLGGSQ